MKLTIHNDDAGGEIDPNGSDLAGKAFYSFTLCETDISLFTGSPRRNFIYSAAFGMDTQDPVFDSTVSNGRICVNSFILLLSRVS